jgi:hypothetical protein
LIKNSISQHGLNHHRRFNLAQLYHLIKLIPKPAVFGTLKLAVCFETANKTTYFRTLQAENQRKF